jgi:hypothetical protein
MAHGRRYTAPTPMDAMERNRRVKSCKKKMHPDGLDLLVTMM